MVLVEEDVGIDEVVLVLMTVVVTASLVVVVDAAIDEVVVTRGDDVVVLIGDDVVFELEITPNRPDCLSVAGIAREISALLKIPFKPFKHFERFNSFQKGLHLSKMFKV